MDRGQCTTMYKVSIDLIDAMTWFGLLHKK